MESMLELLPERLASVLAVEIFGNAAWRWILAAVVFLLTLVALRLVRRTATQRFKKLAAATETDVDDMLVELVERTHGLFLLMTAVFLAARPLQLSRGVEGWVGRLFLLVFFVQGGAWAGRVVNWLIERQMRRREEDPAAPRAAILSLFGFFGQVAVWSVALLLALDNVGVDVTSLIAGLGIGGIAIGLALQNVLQDTFASLSIILDRPFETGDFLVVGDYLGTVEKIGIKTTRLRSLSGEQIVLGNNDLLSSRIRNHKRMMERRALFGFGVTYSTPPDALERIPGLVREIVESIEQTRFDRAHFKTFAASSLDFEVVYYVLVPDYRVFMDVQQEINLRLLRTLTAEGVEFAFPTQTVYLASAEAPSEPPPASVLPFPKTPAS